LAVHELFVSLHAIGKYLLSLAISLTIRTGDDPKRSGIAKTYLIACSVQGNCWHRPELMGIRRPMVKSGNTSAAKMAANPGFFRSMETPARVLLIGRMSDLLSLGKAIHRNQLLSMKGQTDHVIPAPLFTNFDDVDSAAIAQTERVKSQHIDVSDIKGIVDLRTIIHSFLIFQQRQAAAVKHLSLLTYIPIAVDRRITLHSLQASKTLRFHGKQSIPALFFSFIM
jgi:hypothetical protein